MRVNIYMCVCVFCVFMCVFVCVRVFVRLCVYCVLMHTFDVNVCMCVSSSGRGLERAWLQGRRLGLNHKITSIYA